MDKVIVSQSKLSTCLFVFFLLLHVNRGFTQITTRTYDQFAGMCLLPDDPAHIANAGGYARPYILSKWFLYDVQDVAYDTLLAHPERLEFAFDPSYANNSNWINDGLRSFHEAGMDVVPSFKESFMFLTENRKEDLDNKPRLLSEDGNDPWSWRWIGIYFYQFAAHYGSTQVPDSMLLLREDQARISGLGWVKYMQGENEADKWWLGEDSQFTPEEWAAYHSVMYDGHMGQVGDSLGLGCGVKAADPNMKVVLGPLAHLDYEYLNKAIEWWEANRTDPAYPVYPFDVMSFHRYANTAGRQRELNGTGQSPEDFGFYELTKEFADFCHEKGKEAWITEFGYDTNPDSPQGIIPFGGLSTEEIQGMWLTRSYLSFSAAGMDRAAMYMLRDVNFAESDTIFETSGFTSVQGAWEKKPSWYYFNTMNKALQGSAFKDTIASGQSDVRIYEFEKGEESVYAIWCPTAENKTVNDYKLNIPAGDLTLITPQDGLDEGNKTTLYWNGGELNISVNELPRFVHLQPGEQENGAMGAWQAFGPFAGEYIPADRHEHGFIEVDGKFYALGGRWDTTVDIYDPTTNTWVEGAESPIRLHHFQAVEWNGNIYVLGAFTGNYPDETGVDKIYIYDPITDSWSEGANIPRKRGSAGAVVYNNKIYLVGGIQNGHQSGHVPWFDEYDPATDTWNILPDAPRARDHFQAALIGNNLILASGRRSAHNNGGLNSDMVPEVDIFDFNTNTWSTSLSPIPTQRAGAASTVINDEVIIIGGESDTQHEAFQQTEAFNINTQSWRALAPLNQGRHATQAINYLDKIYVQSGSRTAGDHELEGHEEFFMERWELSTTLNAAFIFNPSSGNAPLEVNFDGSTSLSASGPITAYTWNLGDGTTASGPQQTHIYTTPGIYTASLSVVNAQGDFDMATQEIEVIDPNRQDVLFITNSYTLGAGDSIIKQHLEGLGYYVVVKSQDNSSALDANGKVLVLISSSISSAAVNTKFTSVDIPVISLEPYLYDDLGMTGFTTDQDFGVEGTQADLLISNEEHPLAGSLSGTTPVYSSGGTLAWGIPHPQAIKIANISGQAAKATIFAYEKDMAMVSDLALARRVGFFLIDTDANQLTPAGWRLFDSTICWAVNCHNIPRENTPPNLSDIPSQSHAQGDTVSIQLSAIDVDGDSLFYSARNLLEGLGIDTINGRIYGVITAEPGNYYVKVLATDDGNPPLSDQKGFSWEITEAAPPVNRPPVIFPIENQYSTSGDTISFSIIATDPEGDSLSYTADNLPTGIQMDILTGEIAGVILASPDTFDILITVADNGTPSESSQKMFRWIISPPAPTNHAPELSPISSQNYQQGSTASLQIIANDIDGDGLTFSATGLPEGLIITPATGLISGAITATPNIYSVEIIVEDNGTPSMNDTTQFEWEITPSPTEIWLEGECATFGDEWNISSDANAVNGEFLSTPKGFVSDNNIASQHQISFSAFSFDAGFYGLWIRIRSGGGYNSFWHQVNNAWQKIDVNNYNDWTWVNLGDVQLTEGYNPITLAKREGVDVDQIVLSRNPDFVPSGIGEIGSNCAPPPNQAPNLANINDQEDEQGTTISLSILAEDPDGNNLIYSATGLPDDLTISPNSGLISGIIDGAQGIYSVIITVTDDGDPNLSDSQDFSWVITAPEINEAPTLTQVAAQSHQQTTFASLQLSATDPNEGDIIIYTALGLPQGLSLDSSTGLISGTITAEPETYIVTVTASDNGDPGLSDTHIFDWEITEAPENQSPVLAEIPDQVNNQGETISISLQANDPDNHQLTFSQIGLPAGLNLNSNTGVISGTITGNPNAYDITITVTDNGSPAASTNQTFSWIINEVVVPQTEIWLEAECATFGSEWISTNDATASNEDYLTTQAGFVNSGNISAIHEVTFEIFSSETATYSIWLRIKSGGGYNSIWQNLNGNWQKIDVNNYSNWTWVEVNNQTLSNDNHTITFAKREGVDIDKIVLSSQNGFTPSGLEEVASNCGPQPNRAPILTMISDKSYEEAEAVSFFAQASDPDGDQITYAAIGLPTGLSIHPQTGHINGILQAAPGTFNVAVTATDDGEPTLSTQTVFDFTVTEVLPNQAPNLSSINNQTHQQGTFVSIFVDATDPEGDNIIFSATGLPNGIIMNANTGEMSGTISALPNTYLVTVSATDDGSPQMIDTENFTWTITEIPEPSQSEIWLEAECVTYGSDWFPENTGDASNGEYINTDKGFVAEGNISNQHIIEIQANISQATNYHFWVRIKSASSFNSIWQEMNGSWERFDVSNYSNWTWVQLQDMNMQAGLNTAKLAKREGITIDKFVFSSDDNFNPSGIGENADNCGTSRMGQPNSFAMRVYPNPATQNIHIEVENISNQVMSLSLIDMMGKAVFHKKFTGTNGRLEKTIDIGHLAKGVYFVELLQGRNMIREVIVVR